jgi:hypothetical protein
MLKPNSIPPLEKDLILGIRIDEMGVETLGKLMDGDDDMVGIP